MKCGNVMGTFNLEVNVIKSYFENRKLTKVIEDLKVDDKKRVRQALKELDTLTLNKDQINKLTDVIKTGFEFNVFPWKSTQADVTGKVLKSKHVHKLEFVDEVYDSLDRDSKKAVIMSLSRDEDINCNQRFLEILLAEYESFNFIPYFKVNNQEHAKLLFPRLIEVCKSKKLRSTIYDLLGSAIKKNYLVENDYHEIHTYIREDYEEFYRNLEVYATLKHHNWQWDTEEYLELRYLVLNWLEMVGEIQDQRYIEPLRNLLLCNDNMIKSNTALALIGMNEEVDEEVLESIVADYESRKWFLSGLENLNKIELYPNKFNTQADVAESDFVNWLVYPTELGRKPDEIELVHEYSEDDLKMYLFKFRTSYEDFTDHDWLVGASGPFKTTNGITADSLGFTFSSFEKFDSMTAEEHLEELIGIISEWREAHKSK